MSAERQNGAAGARSADVTELEQKPAQPDPVKEAKALNVAAE
ncbi:hypothetical protein [Mesorhizobium sp. M1156]